MSFTRRILSNAIVQMLIEFIVLFAIVYPVGIIVNASHIPSLNGVTDEVIIALLTFGVYFLASTFLERRPLAEMGLPRRYVLQGLILGFALGGVMMCIIIGILALAGWYHVTQFETGGNIAVFLLEGLVLFFCAAAFEEVGFRGIIFRLSERAFGSWIALGLSALIFGASHLANPHATIVGALAIMVTGGLAGAALFMLTRSLWPVIGFHCAWDYFEGYVFGVPVSGINLSPVLHSTISGPELWTGGSFGPESGLIVAIAGTGVGTALLVLAIRRGHVITPRWMKRGSSATHTETVSSSV